MFIFSPTPVIDDPLFKIGQFPGDDETLNNIVKYCDTLTLNTAEVGFEHREVRTDCRVSRVAWVHPDQRSNWIYQHLSAVIQDANARWYHFDLAGFFDSLQYTVYDEAGSHFDWHLDMGDRYGGPQRKLSVSLILSDPSEYEGGEFQIMEGAHPRPMPINARGTCIVFPSYVIHRVTPVTRGVRKALVGWACGPKFR